MTDRAAQTLRVFIGKHPCDDLPHIVEIDPDPRSEEWQRYVGPEGDDYSGWYTITLKDRERE